MRLPVGRDTSGTELVRYGFLLLPEFSLYSLIPAIEALRIANQNSGRKLYSWLLLSADGKPVKACNGMSLTVDAGIGDVPWFPTVFVCGGNHPTQHLGQRVLSWLRRLARHGAVLGCLDTGAFALAAAGLLDGYKMTLHWESISTLREQYPDIEPVEQIYVIDRDRITCAGGNAALDLMLQMIARRHGPGLAQIVANAFVAQRIRRDVEPQRLSAQNISGDSRSPFTRILHDMEENLEEPLSAAELARRAGISVRALGRILRDRVHASPMRYYLKVRLQAARNALFYSDIPIQEVAVATGFSSPAVFSRTFHAHFGVSPRDFRQQFAREQLRRFRPELEQQLGA